MKRFCFTIYFILSAIMSLAQPAMDGELISLISSVIELRDGGTQVFDDVRDSFVRDTSWTPMDETGPFRGGLECHPSENVPRFRLNAILNYVARQRSPVYLRVESSMLSGEDPRYDYSLFERSVHEGCTVEYVLAKREGQQWFVIVPHSGSDSITASISVDGGKIREFVPNEDGTLVLYIDEAIRDDQLLTLTVNGVRSDSFVIINHNTRNK